MSVTPFPLIEVSGSPSERGRQYGRQARERVRLGITHYVEQLKAMNVSRPDVLRLARGYLPRIEEFDENYLAEMRGIAEGAEVEPELIVLLNARTEILQLGKRMKKITAEDDPDGCTGAILLPEATADGVLVHGQNWDWKAECAETAVVLKVHRDDGPDFLTFTEAGGLARCGMNACGIGVTANYIESDRDYAELGVPLALIRRKTIEQEHLAQAIRTAYCTPKTASNNLMISHAGGFGIDIECAPQESFPLYPQGGILVHANHWQSPVALSKLRDATVANTPDSLYRDVRVRTRLEADRGRLSRAHLRDAFFDDFGYPWSVCRPPRQSFTGNLSATVAMILMEPANGLMEVTPLPALNRTSSRYSLTPESRGAVA